MSCSEDTISVVQSLPVDVLREIFKYLSVPFNIGRHGLDRDFPWYLGHVCSSWRAEFLSMRPEFWSKFEFFRNTEPSMIERYEPLIDTFLRNNRGAPISFKVNTGALFPFILVRFVAESTHICTLNVVIGKQYVSLLRSIKNRIPLLHTLSLRFWQFCKAYMRTQREPHTLPEGCCDIFENAPLLTRVRLSSLSFWQFNWPSLTVLELVDEFATHRLADVLRQTTNLERLLFHQLKAPRGADTGTPLGGAALIVLPRLKVLTLFGVLLLHVLTAPSLEELYVDDIRSDCYSRSPPDIVTDFLQRSSCKLERLGIGGSMNDLEVILQHVPDIKFLAVHLESSELSYLYSSLKHARGQALLAPSIQSLRILYPEIYPHSILQLKTMLAFRSSERCDPINRLREFTIVWWRDVYPCHEPSVGGLEAWCRNQGIQFKFELDEGQRYGLHRLSGWDDDGDDEIH